MYKDHLKRPKWKDKATKHRVNLHEVWLRNLKDNRENHINPISSKFKMFFAGKNTKTTKEWEEIFRIQLSDLQF